MELELELELGLGLGLGLGLAFALDSAGTAARSRPAVWLPAVLCRGVSLARRLTFAVPALDKLLDVGLLFVKIVARRHNANGDNWCSVHTVDPKFAETTITTLTAACEHHRAEFAQLRVKDWCKAGVQIGLWADLLNQVVQFIHTILVRFLVLRIKPHDERRLVDNDAIGFFVNMAELPPSWAHKLKVGPVKSNPI